MDFQPFPQCKVSGISTEFKQCNYKVTLPNICSTFAYKNKYINLQLDTRATKLMEMGRMRPEDCLLSTPALHTQNLMESQEPFNILNYTKADAQEWPQQYICTKEKKKPYGEA